MKTIRLVLVFAATLAGVWPVKSADTNSITGVYILETVNGEKLSAAVAHEGSQLKIRSGAFTISADGTCSSKITVLLPSGEETTVVVKATYRQEGSKLNMQWQGAGSNTGTVNGNTFTMDNEGMIFSYQRSAAMPAEAEVEPKAPATAEVFGVNLLSNPDFEKGKEGWTYLATGEAGRQNNFWNLGPATNPVHSGSGSFKMFGGDFTCNCRNLAGVVEHRPCHPGAVYAADAWILTSANDQIGPSNKAFAQVQFEDSAHRVVGRWRSAAFNSTWPADTWVHLVVTNQFETTAHNAVRMKNGDSTMRAPAGASSMHLALCFGQDQNNRGSVYWDDASLKQLPNQ
jgi:hypothetical protein